MTGRGHPVEVTDSSDGAQGGGDGDGDEDQGRPTSARPAEHALVGCDEDEQGGAAVSGDGEAQGRGDGGANGGRAGEDPHVRGGSAQGGGGCPAVEGAPGAVPGGGGGEYA